MIRAPGRGRWVLIGLLVLFALPVWAAWGLYCGLGWRGDGAAAAGRLVSPAAPLPDLVLHRRDGQPAGASTSRLRGRWHVLQIAPQRCATGCRQRLAETRQAVALLHIDAPRVQRMLVIGDNARPSSLSAQPDLAIFRIQMKPWLARFRQAGLDDPANQVYLIDPAGRWMAYYSAPGLGDALHRDLVHLLSRPAAGESSDTL